MEKSCSCTLDAVCSRCKSLSCQEYRLSRGNTSLVEALNGHIGRVHYTNFKCASGVRDQRICVLVEQDQVFLFLYLTRFWGTLSGYQYIQFAVGIGDTFELEGERFGVLEKVNHVGRTRLKSPFHIYNCDI